jgi:predicted DNA-binding transcriptional regulator AlpA
MVIPGQTAFPWSPAGAERHDDEPQQPISAGAAPAGAPLSEPPQQEERQGSAQRSSSSRCGISVERPPSLVALPPENELWDIGDAARFLKMSTSWVYKRVERGDMPCRRIHGWALRFVPAELRAWASKQPSRRRSRAATTER